jgi:hypothetical protein
MRIEKLANKISNYFNCKKIIILLLLSSSLRYEVIIDELMGFGKI